MLTFFSSCRTHRIQTSEEIKTTLSLKKEFESQTDTNIQTEISQVSTNFSDILRAENENFTFRLAIYDTEKPIDSITGRPPLQAELIGERNIKRNEFSIITEQTETNIIIDFTQESKITESAIVDFTQESKITTDSEKKPPDRKWLKWSIISIFIILIIVGYRFLK